MSLFISYFFCNRIFAQKKQSVSGKKVIQEETNCYDIAKTAKPLFIFIFILFFIFN